MQKIIEKFKQKIYMRNIIEKFLKISARAILKKQRPQIVSITGSMGKTSTKEAIYLVLKEKFRTRRSIKNYNNELGVPLTILGEISPERSFFDWLKIFFKAIGLIILKKKNYPQILVLETAADKPGDLKYLMEIFPSELLKIAVLTSIAPVHLEFFETMENIFKEKIIPFFHLGKEGFAVINKDDCNFEKIKSKLSSKVVTYGLGKEGDLTAKEIKIIEQGLSFNFNYKNNLHPFLLEQAISFHQLYPLLAAASVGICYEMNLKEICKGLKKYRLLAGRMRKIKGINNSVIIDDTYNSSPQAAKKTLEALANLPFGRRKIVVLGDMLELGALSQKYHGELGKQIAKLKIDYLVTLGEDAKYIFEEAVKNGFPQNQTAQFNDIPTLVNFVENLIRPADILLIKGSRAMRMEKLVKEIMVHPEKAKSLLIN